MNERHVLVITNDTVLGYAMTNLIFDLHDGMQFTKSQARTPEELGKEIDHHFINVLLLEKSHPHANEKLLRKILKSYPELKMIFVNEENNWLQIIDHEDVLMKSSKDLVSLIRSI